MLVFAAHIRGVTDEKEGKLNFATVVELQSEANKKL